MKVDQGYLKVFFATFGGGKKERWRGHLALRTGACRPSEPRLGRLVNRPEGRQPGRELVLSFTRNRGQDGSSIRVELYHREEDGWKLHTYGPGAVVRLESFEMEFPIDILYRGMVFPVTRNSKKKRD